MHCLDLFGQSLPLKYFNPRPQMCACVCVLFSLGNSKFWHFNWLHNSGKFPSTFQREIMCSRSRFLLLFSSTSLLFLHPESHPVQVHDLSALTALCHPRLDEPSGVSGPHHRSQSTQCVLVQTKLHAKCRLDSDCTDDVTRVGGDVSETHFRLHFRGRVCVSCGNWGVSVDDGY